MSKYISPWHLSLLCSIFALMHWQQLRAATACHQLVLQLSNWHSLPLPTNPKWNKLRFTAWPNQLPQLTLCQVTGEEIETATKLLEKACHKLRGIPEQKFRPSGSLTLTMQRANYINLVAFWMVAPSQQAMKSVKCRKLCCYCPAEKGSSTSSEEH